MASDPVAAGLVASLAWPGGNITGLSDMQSEVGSKTLELLRHELQARGIYGKLISCQRLVDEVIAGALQAA